MFCNIEAVMMYIGPEISLDISHEDICGYLIVLSVIHPKFAKKFNGSQLVEPGFKKRYIPVF